jgi:hypothetical protein
MVIYTIITIAVILCIAFIVYVAKLDNKQESAKPKQKSAKPEYLPPETIYCPACGKEVSKTAKRCPNCGHDLVPVSTKILTVLGIISVVLVVIKKILPLLTLSFTVSVQ